MPAGIRIATAQVEHYYTFEKGIQERFTGKSLNKKNWDILRTKGSDLAFALEENVKSFEENCIAAEWRRIWMRNTF